MSACTGTRVPTKTGVPPRMSGSDRTTDESFMAHAFQVMRAYLTLERARTRRSTFHAHECRLHSLSSQSVEAEISAAGGRGRRALPRVRPGSKISLRAGAQVHALRCAQGKAVCAARFSRARQERDRAGVL